MPLTDIVIVRIPALPEFTGSLANADEFPIWKASNDTTYHLTFEELYNAVAGVILAATQPIKFTTTTGVNAYTSGTVPALARLAGLSKSNIDLVAQDAGNVPTPLYGWNGTTFSLVNEVFGGEEITIFFHLNSISP